VVLSSHLIADLERVCDYLIVLVGQAGHQASRGCWPPIPLTAAPCRPRFLTGSGISASHTDRDHAARAVQRAADPAWSVPRGRKTWSWPTCSRPDPAAATTTWRCTNDLADLASVPHASRHRDRGACGVRDPAGGHRAAPGQLVCRQRDKWLPRPRLRATGRQLPHRAWSGLPVCVPARPRRCRPRPRRHRHLLGRSPDRPRARDRDVRAGLDPEHHPRPMAGRQARAYRPDRMAVTERSASCLAGGPHPSARPPG
jgi:hypothetical protein